ncbi:phytanoyl-CoA dioxygenase [Streptomyces sp. GS7]|uniref:phytanoyl-CoA dioxygenase n=1 Tax=Streptomyces sp. GS7 TaxID=2692234 RepID=UPI00131712FC|nr:phytanoyl-CoA dioxygenase [Streptomyces sp. GS7]QHC24052.1 phytanoyl-CoA dioxygenase [Streptomyces sp. GS7]
MDVEGFVRDGYVAVRGAFDADTARACREMIWESLGERGVRREAPDTWRPSVEIPCPSGEPFTAAATSPVLTAAYDELIGPGRWTRRDRVGGAVPVRFPSEEYPGMGSGYHVEGSYEGPDGGFWVNLRSRARGLLALFLFSDTGADDAPTRLVKGSHLHIPPVLRPFGETGVPAEQVESLWRPSVLCRATAHATGKAGDVYLCHPFIVHTATWPHRGTIPRMMAQPAVHVREGFIVDGSDPSPVARAITAGLAMSS